jgi:hypothetical protein
MLAHSTFRPEIQKSERIQGAAGRPDKVFVSVFLQHAEEILRTAEQGGTEDCRLSILVGWDGGIRMVAGSEWELEPLRIHHGARAAYRVTRNAGAVRLEGCSADRTCLLQSGGSAAARPAWADFPRYQLA